MGFSENIKLEAKRRSNFKCCVCQIPFVEVHHIISQEEGGPDTLENAAPLCGGCHQKYGGNPELRKQLREIRDHWWAICANQNSLPTIYEKLDTVGNKVDEVKSILIPFLEKRLDEIRSAQTSEWLAKSFGLMASGTTSEISVVCPKCGRPMRYVGGINYHCENCEGSLGSALKL